MTKKNKPNLLICLHLKSVGYYYIVKLVQAKTQSDLFFKKPVYQSLGWSALRPRSSGPDCEQST